ncbi:M56 family metallopeptidase [Pontibacter roseus]|uniref:M56 family metallopeptidase n=1 Tax=Pontibacter roseus TaxID=336989 RepID=UPI00036755C8|nr:M56 family metallopeptidase [Pontibacter roseus]
MNFNLGFLPETLTNALGWALLHSLWQGALTGLVLALLLILLNRHSARLRYTVSMLGLATELVLFVATFIRYYSSEATTNMVAGTTLTFNIPTEAAAAPEVTMTVWERLLDTGKLYFTTHLPLFVSLWLLGLLLMTLRFMGGLAYVQRLRHYGTHTLGQHWQETLQQVKQRMGVHHSVRFVESALVQVPMAIGYFKPVILFPIGAITGLSQQQVEAVLAHELAHVLRHDYLFNMLQQVMETLFFFHPAVWWMSGMARTEREHCCDDMAVKACGDRVTYARALAQLEGMRMPAAPTYAVALTGSKGTLLTRVKRLVYGADLRPSFSEGFLAALVVVGGFMLLSFGAWAGMKQPVEEPSYTLTTEEEAAPPVPSPTTEADTEALEATSLTMQDSLGRSTDVIIIKNKKGKVTELYVNGKRIPKKDIPQFEGLINQRLQATKRAPRIKQEERAAALRATEEAMANVDRNGNSWRYSYNYTVPDSMDFHFDVPPVPPIPPMPPMPLIPPLAFSEGDEKIKKQAQKQHEEEMKKYEKAMQQYGEKMKQYAAQVESTRTHVPDMRRHEDMMKRHGENMERHAENMRRHEANMRTHEERMENIEKARQEMVKDGLLKKDEQLTDFSISDEGLFINGQKQSQALYNKYRNLLKTKEGKSFDLTYKRDGDNVQIDSKQ